MITIDEQFIGSVAPNADASKNGRSLVLKNKFLALNISEDNTLIFGECAGSGKTPYSVSCDFSSETTTYRCSCPSRQFPCKHALGLMYAFAMKKKFTAAPVPEALQEKREKLQQKKEKKKVDAEQPRQVDKKALAKKIKAQLEGLDLLEKLTHELVRLGIGNMNAKLANEIEQQAKQLGDAYLPGARMALYRYTKLFSNEAGKFDEDLTSKRREEIYSDALDQLSNLNSLVKQGRTLLNQQLVDPEMKLDGESTIASWLGYAWQLRELKEMGLVEANAELVQLAFNSYDDIARQEYVDTGVWMTLGNGQIRLTQNFRPYRAAKYIKSDDSFFQVAQIPELCIYPGDINPRIRWESFASRSIEAKDFQAIRNHGKADFAAVINEVKNHLKNPLTDKHPIYALNFARIGKVGDEIVAEDAQGKRLAMTDSGMGDEPPSTHLFGFLAADILIGQTLIARFKHDLDNRTLRIKPLSIATAKNLIRLTL